MSGASVLLVTPYQKQQRGNSITSQRLQKGLSQLGYEVVLVSLDSSYGWSEAAQRLSQRGYQLLHVLHAVSVDYVLQRLPAAAELPLILTTTGTDINIDLLGSQRSKIEKAFNIASRVVVFHHDFVPVLTSIIPTVADKLRVIPQGVDLPDSPAWSCSRLQCQADDLIAVLPSGIRPVKRIEWALEAMETAAVYQTNLHLLIAGPVIDSDYAHAIMNRINQTPRTKYLGEVKHQEIAGLYKAADMVLNTSLVEGQPQAALEGMSVGLPVIMSRVPGNLGIITPGKEGFYVENPQELAEAMLTLADSNSLRQKMGAAAADLVKERYSKTHEWEQYHFVYQELIGDE